VSEKVPPPVESLPAMYSYDLALIVGVSNVNVFVISFIDPAIICLIPYRAILLSSGSVLLLTVSAVNMSSQIFKSSVAVTESYFSTRRTS
jgi:hypothetical protein